LKPSGQFVAVFLLACLPVAAKELTPHQVYDKASSAVVLIQVDEGTGSGFLISADGKIITNFHMIAHAKNAIVRLENGDTYDDVQVLDIDKRKDIAILKIKAVELPFLKLGKSVDEDIGSTVYTISNPAGYQNTLSQGLISSVRTLDGFHVLQITAPISHGSSGGPLFNAKGEVIGITSSLDDRGQNLNFAIPVDYVRGILASPSQAKPLASVYDPSSPSTATNGKQPANLTLAQRGKLVAQAVGQITLTLLTSWFIARVARRLWIKNNQQTPHKTRLGRLWLRLALPALLCVATAILIAFAELYSMTHPQ
jgi:S1-C subfamily serine protease